MKLYRQIASLVDARLRSLKEGSGDWVERHEADILQLVDNNLPSGSGWDCGTKIDLDRSTGEKLCFYGSWHHMTGDGFYDGWTKHELIVTPSLIFGITIKITGRDRNDIKDYLYETFEHSLTRELESDPPDLVFGQTAQTQSENQIGKEN